MWSVDGKNQSPNVVLGPNLQNITKQIYDNVMTYDSFTTDIQ